ncbi:aminotransferase class I/II-fold pyridoxal phosphate-dependent enzyme [Nostoc sp.]|uniref:aminotransferase class I/II-fold pyridoxal phosphate-dependent enzyme n=1 Tax=Nostoc sp. TaxID=1180 RepID=UPI003FA5D759
MTQVKTNVDSRVFKAIQACAIAAYSTITEAELQAIMSAYQNRRDMIVNGLRSLGWPIQPPKATVYAWTPVPPEYSSVEFVRLLLDNVALLWY